MVATHKVKINGKWYGLGAKIPDLTELKIKSESTSLNKTEIKRMSTAELQQLAKKHNIENADNITGSELKEILIKKFNL